MTNLLQLAAIAASDINVPKVDPDTLVTNILNLFYFSIGVVSVIVMLVAALTFITAGGDSAAITRARNIILYAVIGLVFVISAFFITQFITGRF